MAALRTTSLLLLALVALATLSATAEAGYHSKPAHRGQPPCNRYDCIPKKPALFVDFQLVIDLQGSPGLELDLFVASAVVARDQARRVCPGGRTTALNQVQVAVAVEAKVEVGVVVKNWRGQELETLFLFLDLIELAVVRGNVAVVELVVEIDIKVKVLRFICGNKVLYSTQLSVAEVASLAVVPGSHN